jgi:hypothetical protein
MSEIQSYFIGFAIGFLFYPAIPNIVRFVIEIREALKNKK